MFVWSLPLPEGLLFIVALDSVPSWLFGHHYWNWNFSR